MIVLTGAVLFAFTALAQKKAKKVVLKNEIDSVSYLMGVNIGSSLGKEMSEANFELIIQGFRDAVAKGRLVCQDSTDMILSMYFQEKAMIKQAEEDKKWADYEDELKAQSAELYDLMALREGRSVYNAGWI